MLTDKDRDPSAPVAEEASPGTPSLEQLQHWTRLLGQTQQMLLERGATLASERTTGAESFNSALDKIVQIQVESGRKGFEMWQGMFAQLAGNSPSPCRRPMPPRAGPPVLRMRRMPTPKPNKMKPSDNGPHIV